MSQKKVTCSSGGFVWSRELTINLIELYAQHPELYQVNNRNYHNRNIRQSVLQEICENINTLQFTHLTVNDITKKIHGLRTTFFQELNKIKKSECSGASTDALYTPKWWCFEQLHFLKDYGVVVHQGSSNLAVEVEEECLEIQEESADIIYDGAIEYLSDTSLLSPLSNKSQSRPESTLSEYEEQQKEPQNFKKRKTELTPRSKVTPKEATTLQNILSTATATLSDLQSKRLAQGSATNSNLLFGQLIALELDKITNEEVLDCLREQILADVSAAKRRQYQKSNENVPY